MYHLGTLAYWICFIGGAVIGHTWEGIVIGVVAAFATWCGLFKWEFGTFAFWRD